MVTDGRAGAAAFLDPTRFVNKNLDNTDPDQLSGSEQRAILGAGCSG